MPYLLRHLAPVLIAFGIVPILVGCPPRPATTLSASPATLNFTLADASKEFGINVANGTLDWTVSENQPWLTVSPATGNNDGAVTVTVDRTQMDTSQANSGTVTVTADALTDTVNITVAADPPAKDVADLLAQDFAAADTNGDNRLSFEEALTVLPGLTRILFDVIDANGDGFLSERELAAVGGEADLTPIDSAYFPMAEGNSWTYAFGEYGNSLGASSLRLTVADLLDVAGTAVWQVDLSLPGFATEIPIFKGLEVDNLTGDNPAISTYWVLVEGTWYAALSLESLSELPDTSMLLPIGEVLRWPTSLAYLQSSGSLENASNQITGIVTNAALYLQENEEAIYTYLNAIDSGDTEAALALFLAFGNNFDDYESGDPLVDAQVQLLADLGIGLGPITTFFQNLSLILQETSDQLGKIDEMPISLPFWTAWEGNFGSTYTNADPVVEASVRLITQLAYELAVQNDEQGSYSEADLAAYNEYITELFYTIDANAGLLAGDPAGFIDVLQDFATNYASDSPAVESGVGATLSILDAAEALVPALEGHMPFPLDLAGLSTFLSEGIVFSSAYTNENGADPAAALVSVLLGGLQDIVDELEVAAPTLNPVAADLEALETLTPATLIPSFDFKVYAGVFADFESFFAGYAETESDALAGALGAVTGGVSGSLEVVAGLADEVADVPYEDFSGNLETLLPAIPDFPLNRTLADFGIADQSDCVAPGVALNVDGERYTIASTIYAKDVGPAMFIFLPLQYGLLGGEEFGTVPVEERVRQLEDSFDDADTNGDGRLSLTEARATVPGLSQAEFEEIDTNDDESVTQLELQYFGTGADSFEPDDTLEEASPIVSGETQSHTFHEYYDTDWVTIEVTEPVTISLHAAGESGEMYFYLELYDADGNLLDETVDYDASLSYSLYTPGVYFAKVSGELEDESADNGYTLHLEQTDAPELVPDVFEIDDSSEQANPITIGEVQNRTFHFAEDQDWVAIEITDPVSLSLHGESELGRLHMHIELYGSSNNWIGETSGYSAVFSYRFDTPGTYYARISPDYIDEITGNAYSLTLEQFTFPEPDSFEVDDSSEQASTIAVDEVQSRNFHLPNDQDWVAIEITDPVSLTLHAQSETGEIYMFVQLFDASNNWLDATSGYSVALSYIFDTPGTYYALISPDYIDESTGSAYSLTLEQIATPERDSFEVDDSPEQASSIAIGEVQSRTFHVSVAQDWVAIEITEATTLTMSTQNLSGDLDTTLTLFDSDMNEVAYNDDFQDLASQIEYTFDTPGTYYLLAGPLDIAIPGATYELAVIESN